RRASSPERSNQLVRHSGALRPLRAGRRQSTSRQARKYPYVSVAPPLQSPSSVGADRGSAPVLRTEALTVRFGGLTALNSVDFEVGRGEIRAIIGPNGAGKSTFFNCLTGVIGPTSGRILFNGENIAGLPPNRISQKG